MPSKAGSVNESFRKGSTESIELTPSPPVSDTPTPLTPAKSSRRSSAVDVDPMPNSATKEDLLRDDDEEGSDLDDEPSLEFVDKAQKAVGGFYAKHSTLFWRAIWVGLLLFLHGWLIAGLARGSKRAIALLVLVLICWLLALYFLLLKPRFGKAASKAAEPAVDKISHWLGIRYVQWAIGIALLAALAIFLAFDTVDDRNRLRGLLGIAVFLCFLFLFSANPSRVRWRPVLWGLGLQFVMGFLVLRWETGASAFAWFANQVVIFLDYTKNGTAFVWGFAAAPPPLCSTPGANATGKDALSPIFVFSVLQVLIYFGSIVAVLYYLGVMQFVLTKLAWLTQKTLGTTAAESLNACSCIFLGQTEAALLIQPYLKKMTTSELHSVMTVGFACVAGSLFAAYISFGAKAQYILSATVMNAPGSMALSKLFAPETKKSRLKRIEDLELPKGEENNVIECISNGAVGTVHLVWAIASNLVVFLALLAFLDEIVQWLGAMVGWDITFGILMGYLFYPIAWLMGVSEDTLTVAQVIGTKTVLNEFIAYEQLGRAVKAGQVGLRGQMIATYALCGFSNLSSIGIQLGILGGMCPEKKSVFSSIAVRALITGMLTNFTTACIAGLLVSTPQPWGGKDTSGHCMPIILPVTNHTNVTATPFLSTSAARFEL